MHIPVILCLSLLFLVECSRCEKTVVNLAELAWETPNTIKPGNLDRQQSLAGLQMHTATVLAVEVLNNGSFPDIISDIELRLNSTADSAVGAVAAQRMIEFADGGYTLVVGTPLSSISSVTGIIGNVYEVAQLSAIASSDVFTDTLKYPYFSRMGPSTVDQTRGFIDFLVYYSKIGGPGWTDVSIISTINPYTTDLASQFINQAPEAGITVATYQQVLPLETNIAIELQELKNSEARIFIGFIFAPWEFFIGEAARFGLVGDNYVWLASQNVVGSPFASPSFESRGVIGVVDFVVSEGPELDFFLDVWRSADPSTTLVAGPGTTPTITSYSSYDMIFVIALALKDLDSQGLVGEGSHQIPAEDWIRAIRNVKYEGLTGFVQFDEDGNRIGKVNVFYYDPDIPGWVTFGSSSSVEGYIQTKDVIWHSNTTEIPDLDIQEPFRYWSCHNKEFRYDETGKTISLHSPGGSDIDDIDSDYYCDQFIDCKNISDESVDCSSDYIVIFIVVGSITGVLVFFSLILIIFVIVFGIILQYRRLRKASPAFLILLLVTVIIGYISIFAWFGKPHPVGCAFQPWLLGLPAISMITILSVKNFRIWRIFRSPMEKTIVTNWELFLLWFLVISPAILILIVWTIVSTPTASLENRDGKDHYVCNTGGFTGEPGGLIFFFIFVSYSAIVLLIGALVTFATRNVPSQFNETKLLSISIYNLGFLSVVVIPVFLVLRQVNPFAAWIIRTCAILYAFTATLAVQFLPILIGIFLIDKGKNVKRFISMQSSSGGRKPTTPPLHSSSNGD